MNRDKEEALLRLQREFYKARAETETVMKRLISAERLFDNLEWRVTQDEESCQDSERRAAPMRKFIQENPGRWCPMLAQEEKFYQKKKAQLEVCQAKRDKAKAELETTKHESKEAIEKYMKAAAKLSKFERMYVPELHFSYAGGNLAEQHLLHVPDKDAPARIDLYLIMEMACRIEKLEAQLQSTDSPDEARADQQESSNPPCFWHHSDLAQAAGSAGV
jgi:hypothetical protein